MLPIQLRLHDNRQRSSHDNHRLAFLWLSCLFNSKEVRHENRSLSYLLHRLDFRADSLLYGTMDLAKSSNAASLFWSKCDEYNTMAFISDCCNPASELD